MAAVEAEDKFIKVTSTAGVLVDDIGRLTWENIRYIPGRVSSADWPVVATLMGSRISSCVAAGYVVSPSVTVVESLSMLAVTNRLRIELSCC